MSNWKHSYKSLFILYIPRK